MVMAVTKIKKNSGLYSEPSSSYSSSAKLSVDSTPPNFYSNLDYEKQRSGFIESLLEYGSMSTSSSCGFFCWIGSDLEILSPRTLNVRPGMLQRYQQDMVAYDPINISALTATSTKIASLHPKATSPSKVYMDFLEEAGLRDELSFVFWRLGRPIANLSFLRDAHTGVFRNPADDFAMLYSFINSSLNQTGEVQDFILKSKLSSDFGLQPRELQILDYLMLGKSNEELSLILGISIFTVKIHVASIMKKIGVDSRLSLACYAYQLKGAIQ